MANMKSLAKDTAIYGLSSIVGRFLNYMLVPIYTRYMPKDTGDYGVTTNIYAYTALILVVLTFGMETSLFRFANDDTHHANDSRWPDRVFSTAFAVVTMLSALFLAAVMGGIDSISDALGYAQHPEYIMMMSVVVVMDAMQAIPFSYLRFQKRPVMFASLKIAFIVVNLALNWLCFAVLHKTSAFYAFFINLVCTGTISLCFIPYLARIHWQFDARLLRRMLAYSWPMLVLGVAGVANQCADKILFPLIYPDKAEAQVQLGIYGGCVKIAMIMALITQAFRYAYEPIVFAKAKDADKGEYYAQAMKYFLVFTLLAFLAVIGYMPVLQFIIGADYREGLAVVPVVMAAEILMGVYFNLSFWYKLIDKTIYGALFSVAGCVALVAVNIIFIPRYSYWACAWGGLVGYAVCAALSYVVGQRQNPINYPIREMAAYTLLTALLCVPMWLIREMPIWLQLIANTAIIALMAWIVVKREVPDGTIPALVRRFSKRR